MKKILLLLFIFLASCSDKEEVCVRGNCYVFIKAERYTRVMDRNTFRFRDYFYWTMENPCTGEQFIYDGKYSKRPKYKDLVCKSIWK